MSARIDPHAAALELPSPLATTLLELVHLITPLVQGEEDLVDRVYSLVASGEVRLTGGFRDFIARPN